MSKLKPLEVKDMIDPDYVLQFLPEEQREKVLKLARDMSTYKNKPAEKAMNEIVSIGGKP